MIIFSKKIRIYTLIILLLPFTSFAQTIANYQRALYILEESIHATGGDHVPNGLLVNSKGLIHNLGHYAIPGQTKEIPFEETDAIFEKEQSGYMRSTMQNNGYSFVEMTVSKQDSVYQKGFYDNKLSKAVNPDFVLDLARKIPVRLLQLAWTSRVSLRYLGGDKWYEWLSFGGKPVTLFINKKTRLLDRVEYLNYDGLYGDVVFATEYKAYGDHHGVKMPASRIDYEYGRPEREVTYGELRSDIKPDTSVLKTAMVPEYLRIKMAESIHKRGSLIFEKIAPGIELIKIDSQNNKMLVAELDGYIALFEAPIGLALHKQILEELKKRYPGKPLKYLFVTHHHPDHAGGIAAYTELPVTLVTTQGNETYFRDVLGRCHSLGEAVTTGKQTIKIEFVPPGGEKTFGDDVVAYEMGASSDHTKEHLIYYFPKANILWTGDLVLFRPNGEASRGQSSKSVNDLIIQKRLDVQKIYTSWPLKGQREFGTVEELAKAQSNK